MSANLSVLAASFLSCTLLKTMDAREIRESSRLKLRCSIHDYCGGLMEACWLAAVILVPLLYNPHALLGFQPNKVAAMRVLALLASTAWLVQSFAGGRGMVVLLRDFRVLTGAPLTWALGALVVAYGCATAFSVMPNSSFWGSPEYSQGMFTFLCEVMLFGVVARNLRCDAQVDRLVTTILVASFPVALYGILQHAGYDPLSLTPDGERVIGTVGHPIYLGAYIGMVLPLNLWRLGTLIISVRERAGRRRVRQILLAVHGVILFTLLTAFIFTGSRGPLLGLGVMLIFLGVGWLSGRNLWRFLTTILVMGAVGLLVFTLLRIPNGPLSRLATMPVMERFAEALQNPYGTQRFRSEMWRQAPELMFSGTPLAFPEGGSDPFHALRPLVGYGSETLQNVLPHQYVWPGPNVRIENRFHNVVWDLWFATGGLGLMAYLAFFALLFYRVYQGLGIVPGCLGSKMFWWTIFGSTGIGAWIAIFLDGVGFAGLGVVLGLVLGFLVHLVIAQLSGGWRMSVDQGIVGNRAMLLVALLAGLAGHLVETGFAFEVTATSTLFWIYAALILAVPGITASKPTEVIPELAGKGRESNRKRHQRQRREDDVAGTATGGPAQVVLTSVFVTTLILVTMLFGFMSLASFESISAGDFIVATLTQIHGDQGPSYLLGFLFLPAVLASIFALVGDGVLRSEVKAIGPAMGVALGISGCLGGAYALLNAALNVAAGPIPGTYAMASTVLDQVQGLEIVWLTFVGCIGVIVMAGGYLFCRNLPGQSADVGNQTVLRLGLAVALAVATLVAWETGVRPICADVEAGWGATLAQFGRTSPSLETYRALVQEHSDSLAHRCVVRRMLADQLADLSEGETGLGNSEVLLKEAEANLLEARRCSRGLDVTSYELGRLYLRWACRVANGDEQRALAEKAERAFEEALQFQPTSEQAWTDAAIVDRMFLGKPDEAVRKTARAREIVQPPDECDWGNLYRDEMISAQSSDLAKEYASRALDYYDIGINRGNASVASKAECELGKAIVCLNMSDLDGAIASCTKAADGLPKEDLWQVEYVFAQVAVQKGDRAGAIEHITRAIDLAPASRKATLSQFKQQMEGT